MMKSDDSHPLDDELLLLVDRALELGTVAMHKKRVLDKSLRMPSVDSLEKREIDLLTKRTQNAADVVSLLALLTLIDAVGNTEE